MGNVVEVQYMEHRNNKQTVQMLPGGNEFVICSTGEVKEVEHHNTRKDNKKGLYKTFANCRGMINANVTDVSKVRWCTLTYKENMTDPKRLYSDFQQFNQRFQYFCKTKGYSKPEYIVMMEPQGRGAWHAHLLYIWQDMKAPYIANKDFRELWGHGFVKKKKLENVEKRGTKKGRSRLSGSSSSCVDKGSHLGAKSQIRIFHFNISHVPLPFCQTHVAHPRKKSFCHREETRLPGSASKTQSFKRT